MIPVLQCGKCKFGKTLDWELPEIMTPEDLGILVCSQFTDGIPDYVEDAIGDCPKFQPKSGEK